MNNGKPPKVKSANNVVALVHGERYKRILIDNDKSGFYSENNVIAVGLNKNINTKKRKYLNNKKILFTLQITPDFSKKVNEDYVKIVESIINNNADFLASNNYKIIFKHHPRYTEDDCKGISIKHDFAVFDNTTPISDLLDETDLHVTFHSTSAFDAALAGIPTIFIDMLELFSPNEMFLKQYEYPCDDLVIKKINDLKNILVNYDDKNIYINHCKNVYEWSEEFYHDFNEQAFRKFLNENK
jgi:CDP-glycerol glycerophosphotransferase (TagB/SpsB family)